MLLHFLLNNIIMSILVPTIRSSHFLGGTMTWRIENASIGNASIAIRFSQTYSYTYSSADCNDTTIALNLPLASAGVQLTCLPSCSASFAPITSQVFCTDASLANDIGVGQRSDLIVLPIGSDFSAIFSSSGWSARLGGGTWSIGTRIKLVPRPDNGLFNNAPIVTIVSPVIMHPNQYKVLVLAVKDLDGDDFRCRWASRSNNGVDECASVCAPGAVPPNTTLHSNCTVEIFSTTVGREYAFSIMVEDFINVTNSTALSSVPIQFVLKIVAAPTCQNPPRIMTNKSICTQVTVNRTTTIEISAINDCGSNISIIDIASVSLAGMRQSRIQRINSNLYSKTWTWIPLITQLGYQIMCTVALNNEYGQSDQYCLTFFVALYETNACSIPIVSSTTSPPPPPTTTTTKNNQISWPLTATLIASALIALLIWCLRCMWEPLRTWALKRRQRSKSDRPQRTDFFETFAWKRNRTQQMLENSQEFSTTIPVNQSNNSFTQNNIYDLMSSGDNSFSFEQSQTNTSQGLDNPQLNSNSQKSNHFSKYRNVRISRIQSASRQNLCFDNNKYQVFFNNVKRFSKVAPMSEASPPVSIRRLTLQTR